MAGLQAPLVVRLSANMEATAAGADAAQVVRAPIDGTVGAVTYVPEALITGVDTNSRTLQVVNKGQDGTGATVVATLALTSGKSAPAYDETALTLSAVAGALNVAAGDVLAIQTNHVGTGLADPGGLFTLTLNR